MLYIDGNGEDCSRSIVRVQAWYFAISLYDIAWSSKYMLKNDVDCGRFKVDQAQYLCQSGCT